MEIRAVMIDEYKVVTNIMTSGFKVYILYIIVIRVKSIDIRCYFTNHENKSKLVQVVLAILFITILNVETLPILSHQNILG